MSEYILMAKEFVIVWIELENIDRFQRCPNLTCKNCQKFEWRVKNPIKTQIGHHQFELNIDLITAWRSDSISFENRL